MGASLLVPLQYGRETIGLLEIFRRSPQAWTNPQVDQARMLGHQVAASLARLSATSRRRRAGAPSAVSAP